MAGVKIFSDSYLGLDPAWKPVLAYVFPNGAADFRVKAEEAAVSCLYGGIHFRSDNDVNAVRQASWRGHWPTARSLWI